VQREAEGRTGFGSDEDALHLAAGAAVRPANWLLLAVILCGRGQGKRQRGPGKKTQLSDVHTIPSNSYC
jgi:hypothetical protein